MESFRKGRLTETEVYQWLLALRPHAHVPSSNFPVTTVFRARAGGEDDYYFGGVNVEYVDHRLATHGEEGSISGVVTALGKQAEIVEVWVMGAPLGVKPGDGSPFADAIVSCCGKCRQQIAGLAAEEAKIHYVTLNGKTSTTTVDAFLPERFTFRNYIPDLAKSHGGTASPKNLVRKGPLTEVEIENWIKSLESVDYATKISQSMVVRLDNGFYAAGTKVEEAAFQDISAAQAAMANAVTAFGARSVEEVWVYTRGRDEKLPLSSLQVLFEFVKHETLLVHYLGQGGAVLKKYNLKY
jgi:cytidine deaminase